MILHVAGLDKFIPPFVKLIEDEFREEDHLFWLRGSNKKYSIDESETIYLCGNGFRNQVRAYVRLALQIHTARKVMLHGLFDIRLVLVLMLFSWVLPKCYWIIWGGDLYQYKNSNRSLKVHIKEIFRRFVIKRVGNLVTYIPGDAALARQWYDAKGQRHECLMYLSNVFNPITLIKFDDEEKKSINVLVGNSADPSNDHLEAFRKLLPHKYKDIKIFVPLSYGDQENAKKIIRKGREWFGDKFVPLTSFMPFQEYLGLLRRIDFALFNHKRQQAMGNTITLLGLGKSVYIRNDVSQWGFLEELGLKVKSISSFDMALLAKSEQLENKAIVKAYFSKENLIDQWSAIFRS